MTETENVATYARIRPYNPAINEDKRLTARAVGDNAIVNQNGDHEDTYNFTKVFDMKHSTNDAFEQAMKPLLDFKILQGINSIFIVYGQSGSGKSFTLIGEPGHLGVLPMSLRYLLDQDEVSAINVASIEAYGIKAAKIGFYDLVSQLAKKKSMNKPAKKGKKGKKHKKQKQKQKQFDPYSAQPNPRLNPQNAEFMEITKDNCLNVITELQEVSHMAPTLKNPHSSRGHTVYFCRIIMKSIQDVYFICVDLAGSEGQTALGTQDEFVNGLQLAMSKGKLHLNKTGVGIFHDMYKKRSLEAGCINNGLTQLQTIFGELIRKKISKSQGLGLRKVLSSFISLKSAYAIMFTLSASANNNKVTKATLNFAKQTQLVKVDTQKAKKKIDKDAIIKELNALIEQLKHDVAEKDGTIDDLMQKIKDGGNATNTGNTTLTVGSTDDNKDDDDDLLDVASFSLSKSTTAHIFSKMDDLTKQIEDARDEEKKWNIQDDDIQKNQFDEDELKEIFNELDTDGDGAIRLNELHNGINKMGKNLTIAEVKHIFEEADSDHNGCIDFDEFHHMVELKWFVDSYHDRLQTKIEHFVSTTMHYNPFSDDNMNLDALNDDGHDDGDDDDDDDIGFDILKGLDTKRQKHVVDNSISSKDVYDPYGMPDDDMDDKAAEYEKRIKELENKLNKLGDDINKLTSDNDALKTDNNTLKTNNDALKTDNDALKSDNDALQSDKDKLQTDNNVLKTGNDKLKNDNTKLQIDNENYKLKNDNDNTVSYAVLNDDDDKSQADRGYNTASQSDNKMETDTDDVVQNNVDCIRCRNLKNDLETFQKNNDKLRKENKQLITENKQLISNSGICSTPFSFFCI